MVGGLRSPTLLDFKLLALALCALACGFLGWLNLFGYFGRLIANGDSLTCSHQLGQVRIEGVMWETCHLCGDVLAACACEGDASQESHTQERKEREQVI